MNRTLRNLLFLGSFFVFFAFFFLWTLPDEAIKNRVIYQAQDVLNRQLGLNYRLRADELSFSIFTGITFDKLQMTSNVNEDAQIKIDRLRINPSLLSILFGKTKSSVQIKSGKGVIEGTVSDDSSQTRLELEIDNYNLGFAKTLLGVAMEGIVEGEIDVRMNKKNNAESKGSIKLDFKNAKMLDVNIPLDPSNPSSAMRFSELKIAQDKGSLLEMNLKGSSLDVLQFNLNGDDLNLNLKGKILLGKSSSDTSLNLEGKFKVSPQVVQTIPFFALIEPQKNSDGSFDVALEGKMTSRPLPVFSIGKFRDILNQFSGQPNP